MEKKITITNYKFIKKVSNIIDISNVAEKNNILFKFREYDKLFRETLYYETVGVDKDGNERNGFTYEQINIPIAGDVNEFNENRRNIYINQLKARFGVDKIPNKKENHEGWDFFIKNIDVFYPMILHDGEKCIENKGYYSYGITNNN